MKQLVMLACLLTLLLSAVGVKAAPLDDFNIYYVNGINNDPRAVLTSVRVLKEQLIRYSVAKGLTVDGLYNQSEGFTRDRIEATRQAELQGARDSYLKEWLAVQGNFAGQDLTVVNAQLQKLISGFDERSFVLTPDLARMVGKVEIFSSPPNAARKKKTILVAHSQGNFFANQIVNNLVARNSDLAGCIGIVSIASPATFISGTPARTVNNVSVAAINGRHLTRPDDVVIGLARKNLSTGPGILPVTSTLAVPPGSTSSDAAGHNFVASYMLPFGKQVTDEIVAVANQINANNAFCDPPPPPPPPPVDVLRDVTIRHSLYGVNGSLNVPTRCLYLDAVYVDGTLKNTGGGDATVFRLPLTRGTHSLFSTGNPCPCSTSVPDAYCPYFAISYIDGAGRARSLTIVERYGGLSALYFYIQ